MIYLKTMMANKEMIWAPGRGETGSFSNWMSFTRTPLVQKQLLKKSKKKENSTTEVIR
jgi:hypothetical protein